MRRPENAGRFIYVRNVRYWTKIRPNGYRADQNEDPRFRSPNLPRHHWRRQKEPDVRQGSGDLRAGRCGGWGLLCPKRKGETYCRLAVRPWSRARTARHGKFLWRRRARRTDLANGLRLGDDGL